MLENDASVRRFFEGESDELPDYYRNKIKSGLGPLWDALPDGALVHDQNAYYKSQAVRQRAANRASHLSALRQSQEPAMAAPAE
jgi:hypothetical protein